MGGTQTYPRLFGNYVLLAPLAQGGMGELHLALAGRDDLRKLCVVKTIISHLADREFVNRFLDEAKLMVKLSHGNLVPVFESGVFEGQYFLVMEFIEGKDLRALWNSLQEAGRRCPLDVALHMIKEICRGLSYAHRYGELGLVHRDINPPNILLSYSGEVRVTDFGLATSTIKVQKTAPGILFGKLAYMSPEQARNEPLDHRADIFAVGVILWELVTNQRFFKRKGTQLDQLKRAADPKVEVPSRYRPNIPPALDLIALRALASHADDRYADAETMRKDLAALLAKVAPTTDSDSLSRLLHELYGDQISAEAKQREELLDRSASAIRELVGQRRALGMSDEWDTKPTEPPSLDELDETEASNPLPVLKAGTMVGGRYRIERLIREGGMGTVYEATHTGIERQVAVKILHPIYGRMPDVVDRFRKEAKAASRIGHPNIVEVLDNGTTEQGSVYFVMENLEGADLSQVIEQEAPIAVDRALRIGVQICKGVGAAHEVGIVHRDIKPENVCLVVREGQMDFVKVLDFGIAQSGALEDETKKERLTNPGATMGTPLYMAPEQAAGEGCDHRADVYAVGAVLYEMLAGRPPHTSEGMLQLLRMKTEEAVTPLSEYNPNVSDEVARVIHWCLETKPEHRPQSMKILAYELTKLTRGRAGAVAAVLGLPSNEGRGSQSNIAPHEQSAEMLTARSVVLQNQRKRGPQLAAIGALALGLGGFGLWALLRTGPPKPPPPVVPVKSITKTVEPDAAVVVIDSGVDLKPGDSATSDADGASSASDASPVDSKPKKTGRVSATASLRAGQRQLKLGKFGQARQHFERAARSSRTRPKALVGLAKVAFQRGKYRSAVRLAKRAGRRGGVDGFLVQGNAYFKLRSYKKATNMYKKVLSRKPSHREALRNLAAAKARMGR